MKRLFILAILVSSFALVSYSQKKPVTPPPTSPQKDCVPKLTTKAVRDFLRGKTIEKIDSSDAKLGQLESWTFEPDEFLELDIIETEIQNKKLVSVVEIRTGDAVGTTYAEDELPTLLQGRLRLNFELIADQWTLLKIENLTVKYKQVPFKQD